jgi:hypothetical protein
MILKKTRKKFHLLVKEALIKFLKIFKITNFNFYFFIYILLEKFDFSKYERYQKMTVNEMISRIQQKISFF